VTIVARCLVAFLDHAGRTSSPVRIACGRVLLSVGGIAVYELVRFFG